jgi:hypothetical protein
MSESDKEIVESLKKISSNLQSIDKTLKESKQDKTKTDSEEWKKRIENLIRRVDCECSRRFYTPIGLVLLIMTAISVAILVTILVWLNYSVTTAIISYSKSANLTQSDQTFLVGQVQASIGNTIAIGALVVALGVGVLYPSFRAMKNEELARWYFRRIANTVELRDRLYLRALINMKSKEFDLSLWDSYQNCIRLNCGLFSEESLLKSLLTQ